MMTNKITIMTGKESGDGDGITYKNSEKIKFFTFLLLIRMAGWR